MTLDELQHNSRVLMRKESAFQDNDLLFECRFENDAGCVPQIARAKEYVENWDEMSRNNVGLLFWGMPGNGKTFAAACIANELCEQGYDVRMTTFGDILTRLPAMSLQDKEDYFCTIAQCDLLIIDDFGIERRTEYAQEQVYLVINKRYLSRKPLIVTTNLSISELKAPEGMHERRIYDRVLEMCVPVCFDGESIRRQKAAEKMEFIRKIMK